MTTDKMTEGDLQKLIGPVVEIARIAGAKIVEIYTREFSVEHKEDKSPLTEADMAAHHAIVEGLSRLTPVLPVLSEESAALPFSERAAWRRYWLVDPLDGTREFVKRNGEFTVNIALIEDHVPVLGVILVPVTGLCYYASRAGGAFRVEPGRTPARIRVRPLDLSHVIVAGSRSHAGGSLTVFLENIGSHELISMGSSLKSCLVAEGRADLYPRLGPTSEWDTAAAHCIVEEAGGRVTDTAMRPLRYNTKESLLNPDFFVSGDPGLDWSRYLPPAE
ncbi:MAG: 3'(2'),5'-bisphosphate nucleotidase CysQ [Gammaproteobacteria bacterium]|nr:3'(2'),5'-bisphosphate nucleotidase CysQ [Gammaproteobacteria bacterium]